MKPAHIKRLASLVDKLSTVYEDWSLDDAEDFDLIDAVQSFLLQAAPLFSKKP